MTRQGLLPRWAEALALTSSLGFEFAVSTGVGGFLGSLLDGLLGWRPIGFTIGLGLAGAVLGFMMILRTLRAYEQRTAKGDGPGKGTHPRRGEDG